MQMNIGKIAIIGFLAASVLGACKYEEGPNISLRAKRDRVANEWKIKSLTIGGTDSTQRVNNDSWATIISLFRTGSYSVDYVRVINGQYQTNHVGNNSFLDPKDQWDINSYTTYREALPENIKNLDNRGKWAFEKGHYKIMVLPDLAYDPTNEVEQLVIDWTIVKLKEKNMIVKGRNSRNVEWVMDLEPINKEPYWF